jgi:hypothetical protein
MPPAWAVEARVGSQLLGSVRYWNLDGGPMLFSFHEIAKAGCSGTMCGKVCE